MNAYRTHTCAELNLGHVGSTVRLSGWVHRKRDHGNLLFIDLSDHYGVTQLVMDTSSPALALAEQVRLESVVRIDGKVLKRSPETINPARSTGEVEVWVDQIEVLSAAEPLPFPINVDQEAPEELRLRYRFLDLRRERMHKNVVLRSQIISSLRRRMIESGFLEFQTPILTSSSPEGARDYLVPSRMYPGKFYALPQAPQQFKQLLMVAGFDRYFQIAPCFRDEDSRADRSPGEFYQLDLEMSFVEQDDVFAAIEPVLSGVFEEFSDWKVTPPPYPRIPYAEAMVRYGSDKPDLRNPIQISDVGEIFRHAGFKVFADGVAQGSVVRAIPAPGAADRPRSFFDKTIEFAKTLGARGLAYLTVGTEPKGPLAKALSPEVIARLVEATGAKSGDALFFACEPEKTAVKIAGTLRARFGEEFDLLEKNVYRFCWIVDFPFYELDPETNSVAFSHNPFSMPQGGLEALTTKDPLSIVASQYDIVCNGIELSSGAIRNHRSEVMLKAFEIAGYTEQDVRERFGALFNAFQYGAPPHGGLAPGVDRMVMLLAKEPDIREVIAFPLNQKAQDLLMGAPAEATPKQLRELRLSIVPEDKKK